MIIFETYDTLKQELKQDLEKQSQVALKTDNWTSCTAQAYITVTAHFLTENWKPVTKVLSTAEMPERHTGVYIAQRIQDSIENWGLSNERITAVVHNNVANMNLAIKLIQNISDISCFGHTLQLAVTSGLGISTIHQFVSMAKKIVAQEDSCPLQA